MNLKEKKEELKNWTRENKGKIILGLGIVVGIVVATMLVTKSKTSIDVTEVLETAKEFDQGMDLEIHFINPINNDILWKDLCTESYMNDIKDIGMEYETIRVLNGIVEA